MKLEVLVATMGQSDFSLVEKMGITSNTILANQTSFNDYKELRLGNVEHKLVSTNTRGVGKNRNVALIYASGDVLLFSDDDVKYKNNYQEMIIDEFEKYPQADAIFFGAEFTKNGSIDFIRKPRDGRLPFRKSLIFGTPLMAIKRSALLKMNLSFNELFGGGCIYSHGEDSKFIIDCYKSGLKMYASSKIILSTSTDSSTCFEGYNEKYFYDVGAFAKCAMGLLAFPYMLLISIKIKDTTLSIMQKIRFLYRGFKAFECLTPYTAK